MYVNAHTTMDWKCEVLKPKMTKEPKREKLAFSVC